MRLVAILALLSFALVARGDEALVEAAKEAKAARKTSKTKVITNKDVKKSKSKLNESSASAQPRPIPPPTASEKAIAEKAAKADHEQRLAAATRIVKDLEVAAAKLEQSYYDEDDPTRRDTVIAPQFRYAKSKLDAAREDMEKIKGE
jgi:hypothetical protein